jgi:hypothetical protein
MTTSWMTGSISAAAALVTVAFIAAGCGARRPVLYPNQRVQQVGDAVAQRDVDECLRRADAYIESGARAADAGKVAGQTAVGAGTGAAIGAVGGAVSGNAGRGAAVGAATGATAGFLHGLFDVFRPGETDPVYANFVDRCLREKGYEPIGWR